MMFLLHWSIWLLGVSLLCSSCVFGVVPTPAEESVVAGAVGESFVATAPLPLIGPVWQWVCTLYGDDRKVSPSSPEKYTVTFDLNGAVNVRADCNQKGGTYRTGGQSLAIEINRSTMAMCPEDSLEGTFVRDLTGAGLWFVKDGDLYIDLQFDTGTMQLRQQADGSKK